MTAYLGLVKVSIEKKLGNLQLFHLSYSLKEKGIMITLHTLYVEKWKENKNKVMKVPSIKNKEL